uniref:Uncharacterized protein n=1 Tax=Oryza barthii TaxID=65489 RepID=A0A0D3HMJ6_9ORYZ
MAAGGNLEEARSSRTRRMRPNVCSSASSFHVRCRWGNVMVSRHAPRPSVCRYVYNVSSVAGIKLDTPIMPGTCEYHDRYLDIRPGTRRYKAWYLGIMVRYQT